MAHTHTRLYSPLMASAMNVIVIMCVMIQVLYNTDILVDYLYLFNGKDCDV